MPTRQLEVLRARSAPAASTAAMAMTTYGVERVGCRRPTALGIWRLVDSE